MKILLLLLVYPLVKQRVDYEEEYRHACRDAERLCEDVCAANNDD